MKLAYFPGCSLKTTAKNFDASTLAVANALGIDLIELKRWNCCGTVHSLSKDDVMHYLAPIRNLIRVEEMNRESLVDEKTIITQCAMCYNTLKQANTDAKKDQEKMDKIRDNMELESSYKGSIKVVHLLEVLKQRGWHRISERVNKPLRGLKIAPYYGCLLLRPREVCIDNPDNPLIMKELIETLGAESVDFPYKAKCCGAYHTVKMKEMTAKLSHKIIQQVKDVNADVIATACPLCQYNLGDRQKEMNRIFRNFISIPVVYYTQLLALAFDLNENSIGFEENYPDPRVLLGKKGLI